MAGVGGVKNVLCLLSLEESGRSVAVRRGVGKWIILPVQFEAN